MANQDSKTENNQYQERVIDLNVDGHLMSLASGLYCIYHAPDQVPADEFGFPGLRISLPPFKQNARVDIKTFENDGWLGAEKNAVLVRVSNGMGMILVTVYRNPAHNYPPPQLKVVRLNDSLETASYADAQENGFNVNHVKSSMTSSNQISERIQEQSHIAAVQQQQATTSNNQQNIMKIVAHVQRMGDVAVNLNDWIGIPDSKTWIEGFGIVLDNRLKPEDIEYQAVLGKGWLSPWYKGNQFCGSRGMALPLCGLRVRLSEEAAKKYTLRIEASFIDGTKLGPVDDDTTLSSDTVVPLEAIRFQLIEKEGNLEKSSTRKSLLTSAEKVAGRGRSNIKTKNTAKKEGVLQTTRGKVATKKTHSQHKKS